MRKLGITCYDRATEKLFLRIPLSKYMEGELLGRLNRTPEDIRACYPVAEADLRAAGVTLPNCTCGGQPPELDYFLEEEDEG